MCCYRSKRALTVDTFIPRVFGDVFGDTVFLNGFISTHRYCFYNFIAVRAARAISSCTIEKRNGNGGEGGERHVRVTRRKNLLETRHEEKEIRGCHTYGVLFINI